MTKSQAVKQFNETVKPAIVARYGKSDNAAMRQAWNDFTDALCKNGDITPKQSENWTSPINQKG
jgi:hypothetical protein